MKSGDIENFLEKAGFDKKKQGFKYIANYIALLDDEEWQGVKATAIYHKIARAHGVHFTCIQQAIKREFDSFCSRQDRLKVKKYIGDGNKTADSLKILHGRFKECDGEEGMTEDRVRQIVKEEIIFAMRVLFPERMERIKDEL